MKKKDSDIIVSMRVAIMTEQCMRVPIDHVKKNMGLGRSINQLIRNIIKPEMELRKRPPFSAAVIEMFSDDEKKKRECISMRKFP